MIRFLVRHDRAVTGLLACFAFARLLVAVAAFPLYTQRDEQFHLDRIVRAARGLPHPHGSLMTDEAAGIIAQCETWEYLNLPVLETPPDIMIAPWKLPAGRGEKLIARETAYWRGAGSAEFAEPPGYYQLAAVWYRLGGLLGMNGARMAFWLRALNAFFAAGTVLVAAALGRRYYAGVPLVRFGLPLFLAVVHPENWFAINNVAPLALAVSLGLLLVAGNASGRPAGPARALVGGLCLGGAIVVKLTALPAAGVVALLPWLRGGRRAGAAALAGLVLPQAVAAGINLASGATASGLAEKFARVPARVRSLDELLSHPAWNPATLWRFVADIGVELFPGSVLWHKVPTPGGSLASLGAAVALAGVAAVAIRWGSRGRGQTAPLERMCVAAAVGSLLMLVAPWVLLDFGPNLYSPSGYLIFSSGRYATGALVPLGLVVLAGWARLCRNRISPAWQLGSAGGLALGLVAHEAGLVAMAIRSDFNWFHLP